MSATDPAGDQAVTEPAGPRTLCFSCRTSPGEQPAREPGEIPASLAQRARDSHPAVAHVASVAIIWRAEAKHQAERLAWDARHNPDRMARTRRTAAITEALAAELTQVAHDMKQVSQR